MDELKFKQLLEEALKNVLTKDDAKNFATKNDVRQIVKEEIQDAEIRICEDIGDQINDFANELDEKKSDKLPVVSLEQRLQVLERKHVKN